MGIGAEDLLEQELADAEGGGHVAEVEGPGVEGAAGVGVVDEVHVVARDLLGRGGQVVEVDVGHVGRPVGVDGRHVHPGHEGAGEGVEEPFGGLVDFGDAEDVVDVGDDGEALRGDEVGCCVADGGALGVGVQTLDLVRRVSGDEPVVVDGEEGVKVAFRGGGKGEFDELVAAGGCDGASTAWLAR